MCSAIVDVDVLFFCIHATAELLSQNIPVCECCNDVGVIFSNTSHASNIPANSRSLIVQFPDLFDAEISCC